MNVSSLPRLGLVCHKENGHTVCILMRITRTAKERISSPPQLKMAAQRQALMCF